MKYHSMRTWNVGVAKIKSLLQLNTSKSIPTTNGTILQPKTCRLQNVKAGFIRENP